MLSCREELGHGELFCFCRSGNHATSGLMQKSKDMCQRPPLTKAMQQCLLQTQIQRGAETLTSAIMSSACTGPCIGLLTGLIVKLQAAQG